MQMIGPLFGLISFGLFSSYIDPETSVNGIDYPFAITISLAITLILNIPATALLLSDNQKQFSADTQKSLDLVSNLVKTEATDFRQWTKEQQKDNFRISLLRPQRLDDQLESSLLNSDLVRNTYVNLCDLTGTQVPGGKSSVERYLNFLDQGNGVQWIDITGVEDFLDGRYYDLASKMGNNVGSHEINIISDSLPILNFMIVGKDGELREVYYGWLKDDLAAASVYYSKDSRMVDLFNRYFELLLTYKKDHLIVDYKLGRDEIFNSLVIENIRGRWLSVSTSNSITKASDYTKYSVINIGSSNGKWFVVGRVYERSSNKIIHEIKNLSASIFEDGIFYRFERSNADGGNIVKGHGTYTITASDRNVTIGVYVALDDAKGAVQNLRAVKMDSNIDTNYLPIPKSKIDKFIEKIQNSKNSSV
ncbi:MAG: hypothetical protein JKY10_01035 [Cohaesibacteraceae bacterium]|nr:hypothetical protein [Cohaesibacteraceae bacterium]